MLFVATVLLCLSIQTDARLDRRQDALNMVAQDALKSPAMPVPGKETSLLSTKGVISKVVVEQTSAQREANKDGSVVSRAASSNQVSLNGTLVTASSTKGSSDDAPFWHTVRIHLGSIIWGVIFVFLSISIQWWNESRSVKFESLLKRGLEECQSISADKIEEASRGKIVHVQGRTHVVSPVFEPPFKFAQARAMSDANMTLKQVTFDKDGGVDALGAVILQSTFEVYEWTPTGRPWADPQKDKKSKAGYKTEWLTKHFDSSSFKKPSPENPRLPHNVRLGTTTQCASRVKLGAFDLPEEMIKQFRKYENLMPVLPSVVVCFGLQFQECEDGYFYARPSSKGSTSSLLSQDAKYHEPEVGDLRARFLRVPEGEATAIAVQCERDGYETFVPFRPVPIGPCTSEREAKIRTIEEGEKHKESDERHGMCVTGGVSSCCCCPCNTITHCCTREVMTEEIFHAYEGLAPREKPFKRVVPRSSWRVCCFRSMGLASMFLGLFLILHPFNGQCQFIPGFGYFGSGTAFVLSLVFSIATLCLIIAAANFCYRALMTFGYVVLTMAVVAVPYAWGKWHGA